MDADGQKASFVPEETDQTWKAGTFRTEVMRARIVELLPLLEQQEQADRLAGRKRAKYWAELYALICEELRIAENTRRALASRANDIPDDTPAVSER
jgi:hypothetical protein